MAAYLEPPLPGPLPPPPPPPPIPLDEVQMGVITIPNYCKVFPDLDLNGVKPVSKNIRKPRTCQLDMITVTVLQQLTSDVE